MCLSHRVHLVPEQCVLVRFYPVLDEPVHIDHRVVMGQAIKKLARVAQLGHELTLRMTGHGEWSQLTTLFSETVVRQSREER